MQHYTTQHNFKGKGQKIEHKFKVTFLHLFKSSCRVIYYCVMKFQNLKIILILSNECHLQQ